MEATGKALAVLRGKSLKIREFLLRTLLADDLKHKEMLEGIEKVRTGLYP
jgi:hypothetical protein